MSLPPVEAPNPQELTDRVEAAFARVAAAEAEVVAALSPFDGAQVWKLDAMRSATDWLSYRFALARRGAARYSRAATALKERPVVAAAVEAGELSLDQAIAVAQRLRAEEADLEAEARAVERAVPLPVDVLEREARLAKPVPPVDAEERHRRRSLTYRFDHEDGMLRLRALLPDIDGATVRQALRRVAAQLPPNPKSGVHDPMECRMADALVEICGRTVASDTDPDRATIVVFRRGPAAELRFGPTLAEETFDRLCCDARLQVVRTGTDGGAVGIEEAARTVSPSLRRLMEERDGGCTWPGCGRTETLLHAHHIVHHRHGGPTAGWNLTLQCAAHHRAVHEGGFEIRGRPGSLRFFRPDGTPLVIREPSRWSDALAILREVRCQLEEP